jgi:hypothetical protein
VEFTVHVHGAEELFRGRSTYKVRAGVLFVVAEDEGTKRRIAYGPTEWVRVVENEPIRAATDRWAVVAWWKGYDERNIVHDDYVPRGRSSTS